MRYDARSRLYVPDSDGSLVSRWTPRPVNQRSTLLLHCDGADGSTTFTDDGSGARTPAATGNAQIDTAQSVFGGASALFDGTGDYVTIVSGSDLAWGTGDCTIDFRFRATNFTGTRYLFNGTQFGFNIDNGGGGFYVSLGDDNVATTYAFAATTWYHIAICRKAGVTFIFVDGVLVNVMHDITPTGVAGDILMGAYTVGDRTYDYNGHIDEVRMINGVAAWTENFTVPAAAYAS